MYKIVPNNLNLDLIYIGSTTNFRQRKNRHKNNCNHINNKCYNLKVYKMIRDNGGWSEWSMIEIEKYPCADSNECRKRERELMEQFNANLNTNKAFLTPEEAIENKKKYDNNYRAVHKNKEYEYRTKYSIAYRTANREILNAKSREYHEKNRDAINTKLKERRLQKKLEALKLEENSVEV